MAALLMLGFASGLPFALTDDAFRAWMTKAQLNLNTIGWFSLVSLPYSLKFLWSPILDKFVPPFLGRRRGWMALGQIGLFVSILGLAMLMSIIPGLDATLRNTGLQVLALVAIVTVFLSATQDIAIDAYRTDVLDKHEVGAGASVAILGYRVALLLTGWIAFNLADRIGWSMVYGLLALLMGIGLVASFWAPEPIQEDSPPESFQQAVVQPFAEFFQRMGWKQAVFALIFIILFRVAMPWWPKWRCRFWAVRGWDSVTVISAIFAKAWDWSPRSLGL
jgi:PAT family beta-lactamase induction signal transducer AmpG